MMKAGAFHVIISNPSGESEGQQDFQPQHCDPLFSTTTQKTPQGLINL
jgi:hypothetical protein